MLILEALFSAFLHDRLQNFGEICMFTSKTDLHCLAERSLE